MRRAEHCWLKGRLEWYYLEVMSFVIRGTLHLFTVSLHHGTLEDHRQSHADPEKHKGEHNICLVFFRNPLKRCKSGQKDSSISLFLSYKNYTL